MKAPKLVVEYHYNDNDIGAYPASKEAQELWKNFSEAACGPEGEPSHIIIRPAKKGE